MELHRCVIQSGQSLDSVNLTQLSCCKPAMKKQDGLRAAAAILTSASSRAHVKAPDPHRWPQAPDPHTLDPHRQYSTDSAQQRSQANAGAAIRRIVQPPREVLTAASSSQHFARKCSSKARSAARSAASHSERGRRGTRRSPREGDEESLLMRRGRWSDGVSEGCKTSSTIDRRGGIRIERR